jgi:hypothetical protein
MLSLESDALRPLSVTGRVRRRADVCARVAVELAHPSWLRPALGIVVLRFACLLIEDVPVHTPHLSDGILVLDAFTPDDISDQVAGEDEEHARRFGVVSGALNGGDRPRGGSALAGGVGDGWPHAGVRGAGGSEQEADRRMRDPTEG